MDRALRMMVAGGCLGILCSLHAGCGGSTPDPSPEAGTNATAEKTPGKRELPAKKASTGKTDPVATGKSSTPSAAIATFLEAVRVGNHEAASAMLTQKAREETAKSDMVVAPTGSDTASFKVGEVEMVAKGGAHVASTWTDMDEGGRPRTDEIVWMLLQDEEGWRIAGMATKIFEDQPPLVLNFEDHEDMERKQQLAEREMQKRVAASRAAKTPAKTTKKGGRDKVATSKSGQKDGVKTANRPTQKKAVK